MIEAIIGNNLIGHDIIMYITLGNKNFKKLTAYNK